MTISADSRLIRKRFEDATRTCINGVFSQKAKQIFYCIVEITYEVNAKIGIDANFGGRAEPDLVRE